MADWTRRRVLEALGAGAITSPLWALLPGCARPHIGGARLEAPSVAGPEAPPIEEVRERLRRAVQLVGRRHPDATGWAMVRRRRIAVVDEGRQEAREVATAFAVLGAGDGASWRELAVTGVGARSLESAAAALAATGAKVAHEPIGAPPSALRSLGAAPTRSALELAGELFARARQVRHSRLVYRAAHVAVDEIEIAFVGGSLDLAQRVVVTGSGAAFVAWTGSDTATEEAARAGSGGDPLPSAQEIEEAAAAARAVTAVQMAPSGEMDVIFDPSVTALFLGDAVLPALVADSWVGGATRAATLAGQPIAAPEVTLADDPTLPGGYGSYAFDDEGFPAARTVMVDRGLMARPLTCARSAAALGIPRTANARRVSPLSPARPHPSNAALAPGHAELRELAGAVDSGLVVEGAVHAAVDLRTWRMTLRCARAREIEGGRFTGRRYSWVAVHGGVPQILAAVRGIGHELRWFPGGALGGGLGAALGDGSGAALGGGPPPSATGGVPILTRARVEGARGGGRS